MLDHGDTAHPRHDRAYNRFYRRALAFRNRHPRLQAPLRVANRLLRVRPPTSFSGWGMTTQHQLPWIDAEDWSDFRATIRELPDLEHTGESGIGAEMLDRLAWRHWVVAFAARHAMRSTSRPDEVAAVECGVADGVTAFVALRELQAQAGTTRVTMHLYDSWQAIPSSSLLDSERQQAGRYGGLSVDVARRNLASFADRTQFHIGLLPEALLADPPAPDAIALLHVDLNAALATKHVCEFFWPRLLPGALVLFDDYGWLGFEDTKAVVDAFFADKPGTLLKMPTGQALFLRAC